MVIMLPLAVLARGFYRRKKEGCYSEAVKNALLDRPMSVSTCDKAVMTSTVVVA